VSAQQVLLLLVAGIVAGLLARKATRSPGFGFFGDEIVSVTGAFVGVRVLGFPGTSSGGYIGAMAATIAGAFFLLYALRFAEAA